MKMSSEEKEYIKNYRKKKIKVLLIQVVIIISFILGWQILSDKGIINSFVFSSPWKIVCTLVDLTNKGMLFEHIFVTLSELFIAFILGFVISVILAILLYIFPMFYKITDPFLNVLNSLPKVALGPILIIWFGANTTSIIIMAFLINIIVCVESLYVGFIKCNKYYLLLFKTFKASRLQTILYLIIPSSYENIITTLKLNLSMSLIGVLMGEFLVSRKGIGYLIIYGTQVFNLNLVYAGLFILLVLSYFIYKPITILENKNNRH